MKEALCSHRENFQEGGVGPQTGVKMAQRAKMMLESVFVVLLGVDPGMDPHTWPVSCGLGFWMV